MKALSQLAAIVRARLPRADDLGGRTNLILSGIVLAAGTLIRLRQYFHYRPLWHDEAMLAVSVVQRGFFDLLRPLDFRQISPVGFLMGVKAVVSLLGTGEYALRLVPLLSGLAIMPLTFLLARRWSRGWAPVLSLALVAFAPILVYYSSEFKPYSSDALVALILLLLGTRCLDEDATAAPLLRLGALGLLLMWFSHPALFVFGGVLFTLGLAFLLHKDWRRLRYVVAIGLLALLNLGLVYATSMRNPLEDTSHADFWAGAFAPLEISRAALSWYWWAFIELTDPISAPSMLIPSILFIVGLVSLAARRWQWMSLAVAPILLTIAASALEVYPFAGRLLLFTIPLVAVVIAEGVECLRRLLLSRSALAANLAAGALAALLLVAPLHAAPNLQPSLMQDDIRPALSRLEELHRDSDVVYLYYWPAAQFEYYAPRYGLDHLAYVRGITSRGRQRKYRRQLESLAGTPRLWIIFQHNYQEGPINEQQYFLRILDRMGTRLDEFYLSGTTMYLYDLSVSSGQ